MFFERYLTITCYSLIVHISRDVRLQPNIRSANVVKFHVYNPAIFMNVLCYNKNCNQTFRCNLMSQPYIPALLEHALCETVLPLGSSMLLSAVLS